MRAKALHPMSAAQQGLWFLDQVKGSSPQYVLAWRITLRGPLDVPALTAGLNAVTARHGALRTGCDSVEGEPVQAVLPRVVHDLPVHDMRGVPEDQREEAVQRACAAVARKGFSLTQAPLMRVRLFRVADEEHVLALVVHHIVFDARSLDIMLAELSALYAGKLLPEVAQYTDFVAYERTTEPASWQIDYWRERLAGAPAVLELPLDRPRPVEQSFVGGEVRFRLDADVSDRLRELGRAERASLFMVLLAAFQVLLSRWSGQRDVSVGVPVSGRTRSELNPLIGYFVNTLVLRADLSDNPTFRELLHRTRQSTLDAYAHQDVPFERLVQELRPERHAGHNPLFQVLLNADTGVSVPRLNGLDVEPLRLGNSYAKFDLTLDVEDDLGGMQGTFGYRTDVFDRVSVVALADRFELVLRQVVTDPDVRVGDLDVVLAEERSLLRAFNDTSRVVEEVSLGELVARRVRSSPDAVAVVAEGAPVSFAELDARASRLAWLLRELGAGPERLVGVMVPRSVELVVALLAVVRSGAAWLPVDPGYPAERVAFMVSDSAPVVVLTVASVADAVPAGVARVVLDEPVAEGCPATAPPVAVSLDAPAYVIYTSGSTGRPKGVAVSHRSIVNRLLWMQDQHGLGPDDRVLQKTPSSFDVSVWELFWPLIAGAGLVVARPGGHGDAAYIASLVRSQQVTTAHFVPSMLRVFLEDPAAAGCVSLRRVICSGEVLPEQVVDRFAEVLPATGLHNLYGPTEAAVDVTAERCSPASPVTIGRPVWNTRAHVLDEALRLVPVGAPGELHLAGVQLARGYVSRPGLTAQRFVPDPYGPPGSRMYRTGDIARWRRDGRLEYLGRLDDQVKVRGFRVELGEVEAALSLHPAVTAAAVTAREDRPGDKRLVGYVVTAADTDLDEVRRQAATVLPEHMMPSALVRLDGLPLTANGKLDRKALPQPDLSAGADQLVHVAPRNAIEQVVVDAWSMVLDATPDAPRIGAHDHFFDLGGHSLLATRAASLLGQLLALNVPVTVLFENPTVAELAVALAVAHGNRAQLTELAASVHQILGLSEQEAQAQLTDVMGEPLSEEKATA